MSHSSRLNKLLESFNQINLVVYSTDWSGSFINKHTKIHKKGSYAHKSPLFFSKYFFEKILDKSLQNPSPK